MEATFRWLWGNCCGGTIVIRKISFVALSFAAAVCAVAQAPSAPGKPLPPGPMQAKVKAACTQCHNVTRITEQHMTRSEWSQQLEKMEGLGAVIPEGDRKGILDYLSRNFGLQKGKTKAAPKGGSSAD